MLLKFHKYEGAGNDFILIDGRVSDPGLSGESIRIICNRHRGIGADGLIILTEEPGYDFRMTYFNSDGGEVDMCGNGGRCAVLFADDLGIGGSGKLFIGRDGDHSARIVGKGEEAATIEVGMIDVDSFEYSDKTFFLNTGVPHYVEFVDDVDAVDVAKRGSAIRYSERFRLQGGTNVNYVEALRSGNIKIRTYERGVEAETMACGTGAVASAIATHIFSHGDCNDFTVKVPGGILEVSFDTQDNQHFKNIRLTGPARMVFSGEIRIGTIPPLT